MATTRHHDDLLTHRVRWVYDRAVPALPPDAGPTLLVVDGGRQPAPRLDIAFHRWLEEAFPAAQLLGRCGPSRYAAVIPAHPPAPDPGRLLRVLLTASPGLTGVSVTVSAQPLPDRIEDSWALLGVGRAVSRGRPARRVRARVPVATVLTAAAAVVAIVLGAAVEVPRLSPFSGVRRAETALETAPAPAAETTPAPSGPRPQAAQRPAGRAARPGANTAPSTGAPDEAPVAPPGTVAASTGVVLLALGLPTEEAVAELPPGTPTPLVFSAVPDPAEVPAGMPVVAVVRGVPPLALCRLMEAGIAVRVIGEAPGCAAPAPPG